MNRREVLNALAGSVLAVTPAAFGDPAADIYNFLVVGDWGRDGSERQREVAVQMGKAADVSHPGHVISVGDNFYDNGVQSTSDPRWQSSFEDVYSASSLQIPWFVALGNHDYRGVPQAQVDYSRVSTRWSMPSRYYKVAGRDIGAPHLDIFVIDTSPLVHSYREKVDSAIAANIATQDVRAQLRWLDTQLGRSSTPWKIVIGHHTLHSGGSAHGDTPEVVRLIEPLLKKHRVQAYINGHDHDLQHIRRGRVDYIGCGAGSEVRPVNAIQGTLFCAARSGFAALSSDVDSLRLEFRDFTGDTLYRAAIPRRSAAGAVRMG